ncbi:polysaccharide biosynthesis/export family protein [Shewanella surugensis]|uniref:Polysaccharide export protein n=1 Tax=Shewanella surugensis TaxID=212020 RepID=A0ABT0LGP3_9GAMM|nr:polysaccharide biosynthesis/export family protein [Shewanella surugensis]MCL1126839.1 polysaccharide export protein [Shewanella surugensis]
MKYLMRRLIVITGLCVSLFPAIASVSLQQEATAEKTTSIYSSHNEQRYGDWLFSGGFSQYSFSATDPNYHLTQGDKLLIQVWGAIDYQSEVTIDPQGNIFIPKVGPIKVLGVTNAKLNQVILNSVKRVYKANVEVYVSLMSSQQIKVFLSGMVNKPGLYQGQSADSVLRFIDQAGGIREDIGSYRNIQLKRNNKTLKQIDLYDFLQLGTLPSQQFQNGDVIFIGPKQGEVTVEGNVGFSGQYELASNSNLAQILNAVVVDEQATHVTIIAAESARPISNTQPQPNQTYDASNRPVNAKQYTLARAKYISVPAGALIKVSSQLRANSISIDLIGEHNSAQEMVLPWGASLADLLARTQFTTLSNQDAVQLYRQSVAKRQYDMLQASLSALEQNVLTKRSDTTETAQLRQAESKIILQWIEKARQVEPKGQVLLADKAEFNQIILQQGDRIVIPAKRNLIMIHGEVMFPTAIAYNPKLDIEAFIDKAGGTNTDLDDMNILIMKPNGSFITANGKLSEVHIIGPGDEIFVISKPDEKGFQLAKDITQIIFQITMAAAVVLAI